jgi:hypothetical protein
MRPNPPHSQVTTDEPLDQDRSRWGRYDDDPAGDGHARQLADQAFGRLNPAFGVPVGDGDPIARAQAQALEDQHRRGPRVRFAELLETTSPATPTTAV